MHSRLYTIIHITLIKRKSMANYEYLNWSIGQFDNHGYDVSKIYTAVKDYIIYSSQNGDLHYDDKPDSDCTKTLGAISKEMSIIGILKEVEDKTEINNQVALAWRECFNGNSDSAKIILNTLINKLLSKGKVNYVLSSFFAFLFVIIIGTLMMHWLSFHSFYEELRIIVTGFLLGSFGGFISVLIKMRDLVLDPNSNKINILSGISRIIISGTAGIIFYLAYKSGLLLSVVKDNPSSESYFLCTCSFFVGFSERFIPDFSNKIDGLINKK